MIRLEIRNGGVTTDSDVKCARLKMKTAVVLVASFVPVSSYSRVSRTPVRFKALLTVF